MGELQNVAQAEGSLSKRLFRHVELRTTELRTIKAWLILAGGSLAGIAQLPIPVSEGVKVVVGLFGVTMALWGGYLSLKYDSSDLAVLQDAQDMVGQWKSGLVTLSDEKLEIKSQLEALQRDLHRERSLALAHEMVLLALENALVLQKTVRVKRLQTFMAAAAPRLIGPMGLGGDHEWTISIFLKDRVGDEVVMKRIASNWADRGAEENDTRTWRLGKGWTGMAWQYGEEGRTDNFVVLKDSSDPDILHIFDTDKQEEPTDYERFRSVACIPFNIVGESGVFGVVTATSSRLGAFAVKPGTSGRRNFDTIKSFTSVIVALVTAGDKE